MKIRANGISIEVEDSGPGEPGSERPVLLLIMGLGMQLVAWPPDMVEALVAAGYRVVRFDNRDIGLSDHFDHAGKPKVVWASLLVKMGFTPKSPYSLHDMAMDAVGVLDALGIARAHVVGLSMGGMIAQRVALAAPSRTLSLTSIMSSSGARGLPDSAPGVLQALLSRPKGPGKEGIVQHYIKLFRVIGSPGFPMDDAQLRERIVAGTERSWHPEGSLRQTLAIAADIGHRAPLLAGLSMPTLVLHGKADPLVPYAHGEDTARRIPGAQMVGIDGMGHDLAPGVVQLLLGHMLPFWRSVKALA